MSIQTKLGLIGAGALLATSMAHADVITVSPLGGGQGTGINIDKIQWQVTSVLLDDIAPVSDGSTFTMLSQGTIADFARGANLGVDLMGGEWTFQFSADVTVDSVTSIGTGTLYTWSLLSSNFFEIYWDPTKDSSAVTGVGFDGSGDAFSILSGDVGFLSGSFLTADDSTYIGLDQAAPDQDDGVTSLSGQGAYSLQVDTTSFDPDFFLSDVDTLLLADINVSTGDASTSGELTTAFNEGDPSDAVAGVTYDPGTDGQNDFNCEGGLFDTCDFIAQSSPQTSFTGTPVPEPGTMALFGAGLGLLGWQRKRAANRG